MNYPSYGCGGPFSVPGTPGATDIIVAKLQSDALAKQAAIDLLPTWHDLRLVYEAELYEINRQIYYFS